MKVKCIKHSTHYCFTVGKTYVVDIHSLIYDDNNFPWTYGFGEFKTHFEEEPQMSDDYQATLDYFKGAAMPGRHIGTENVALSSEGTKNDQEKPRMELLSSIALTEVAKVLTFGARKYEANNWRKGIAWSRILGAVLRHVNSYNSGETLDPETGLSHMAHAVAECMFILEFEKTHQELDDRYKGEVK